MIIFTGAYFHAKMGLQDLFNWHSKTATQTTPSMPAVTDEDLPADVDEPPDHRHEESLKPDFHKSEIRPSPMSRKVSLLTQALQQPEQETYKPEIHVSTDMSRRRSMMSNTSMSSTAELTSDGGLTSPARTNTPSPPFPNTPYTSFAPFSLAAKSKNLLPVATADMKDSTSQLHDTISVSPKSQAPVAVAPKKRCITFACPSGRSATKQAPVVPQPPATVVPVVEAPKRECKIKWACANPKPADKPSKAEGPKSPQSSKAAEALKRTNSRSPSTTRKSLRATTTLRSHRDSTSTIRRASQSPLAIRAKPKYIIADEKTLQSSEATRFHEFAAGEVQEDDWIRKDADVHREKLTINDTLKKENAIRRLGNEAEQEALEEDEDEDDDDLDGNDSDDDDDDENDSEDDENDSEDDENDLDSLGGSDEEASDGNETDNEAGFAESDDESDGDEEFSFWTPGHHNRPSRDLTNYRASAHRTASVSSNESHGHPKRPPRRLAKIRPGTPDLPDSTDFVCGTLDEDRPLEDAYVSCLEARRNAKHKRCPQDIDPSFPTSEPEDEEDEHDILETANDSDDLWIHGKFEDSYEELHGRRRSAVGRRKSQGSPRRFRSPPPPGRRLHSPPPTKTRLRSPPPRKLFGHSPRRMRSPPPARTIQSPATSPSSHALNGAISFAPLGSRPGLTHTKSLPRTPNAFCRQYHADRLIAANGNNADDTNDGHVRGAIDIVKGLEQKRQRRKEKFYQKAGNRKHKSDRKPQPGKGAERMEQLGLLLSGKTGARDPLHMMSA